MFDILRRQTLLLVSCLTYPGGPQCPCRCTIMWFYAHILLPFSTGGGQSGNRHTRSTHRGNNGPEGGLGIRALDRSVRSYYSAALTTATKKAYGAGKKRYEDFCVRFSIPPLPLTESVLCYFIAYLGDQGLMASSIRSYLSALRQWKISEGLPEPQFAIMPRVKQVLKGIKVVRGKEGRTTKRKLPITPTILRQLGKGKGGPDWEMYWAACNIAFFGFLRAGELTVPSQLAYDASYHLNVTDVSANHPSNPTIVHIRIKASKTDPFRRGTTVVYGRTGKDLCPVEAVVAYLKHRGMKPGPLFLHSDGRYLTKAAFVRWVQERLKGAGYKAEEYSGHSFRVGAATTAASAGIQDSVIKAMGRWESTAYLIYVRIPPTELQRVAAQLAD